MQTLLSSCLQSTRGNDSSLNSQVRNEVRSLTAEWECRGGDSWLPVQEDWGEAECDTGGGGILERKTVCNS